MIETEVNSDVRRFVADVTESAVVEAFKDVAQHPGPHFDFLRAVDTTTYIDAVRFEFEGLSKPFGQLDAHLVGPTSKVDKNMGMRPLFLNRFTCPDKIGLDPFPLQPSCDLIQEATLLRRPTLWSTPTSAMATDDGHEGVKGPLNRRAVSKGMCVCKQPDLVEVECFGPVSDGPPGVSRVGSYGNDV